MEPNTGVMIFISELFFNAFDIVLYLQRYIETVLFFNVVTN